LQFLCPTLESLPKAARLPKKPFNSVLKTFMLKNYTPMDNFCPLFFSLLASFAYTMVRWIYSNETERNQLFERTFDE
jgi:hypothetical protein